jgi:hypothetical protein
MTYNLSLMVTREPTAAVISAARKKAVKLGAVLVSHMIIVN